MKNLEKYVKKNTVKMDSKQTSVNLRRDQHEYVLRNELNLSDMVRDMLDEFITSKRRPKSA